MDDLISRREAVDAIMKLRNAEVEHHGKVPCKGYWELTAAIEMVKLLPSARKESRGDTISRKAAVDLFPDDDLECDTKGGYIAPHLARQMICELPSAQPEPCEDAVSREEAKWVVFCNRDHVEDQANAIDALPPVTPKAEQPDMSEYSDKLWKRAYERGKAEAQDEIVRCKDCKYWMPHSQLGFDEDNGTYHDYCAKLVPEDEYYAFYRNADDYCSRAERKTDGV